MATSLAKNLANSPLTSKIGIKEIVSTPKQTVSVSDMIREEEVKSQQDNQAKLSDYFNKRSTLRKAINDGSFTSGNKAQDVWETRVSKLVDLYLDTTSKATDKNGQPLYTSDKIIEASKNPSKVIEDMKKYYQSVSPDKVRAIDEYIQKGGIASNVYDYLEDISGRITNPYGKNVEEENRNLFDKDTPEAAKGVVSMATGIPSLGSNLAGRFAKWDWLQDLTYNTETKILDDASDEEYRQYKSGKLPEGNNVDAINGFGYSKAKLYDEYAEAEKNGFIGNIDEFKNYKKNIYKTTMEAIGDRMKQGVLSDDDMESSKWAIGGDALTEFITYMAMPFGKVLKRGKELPIVNELINLTVDATIGTAEMAGMEFLKNNPMTKGELGGTEIMNMLVGAITRSPAIIKYLKDIKASDPESAISDLIAKLPEKVKDAYSRLSAEQLKNIKNMTKSSASKSSIKAANEGVKYFGKQGVDAVDKSLTSYLEAGAKLGKEGQTLRNSGVTIQAIEDSLNNGLKNLESTNVMGNTAWGPGKAPEIHINKKKNGQWTLNIKNRENLNMIQNGKGEGLADAMERIFNGMFKNQKGAAGAGMEVNEATLLAFMNEVKGATQGTEWSWGNMGAKVFGDSLDAFRKDANLPQSFLDAEKDFFNAKDLHNNLSDALGSYGKYSSEIDKQVKLFEAGKKLKDQNLQGILELAQDNKLISETIDAEIVAYGYMLALQDEAAARAFFGNVYPSEPGFIEAVLEAARNGVREGAIDKYIASKEKELASKGGQAAMQKLTNGWREMYKAIGGGINIANRKFADEEPSDPYADIDVEDYRKRQESKRTKQR